MKVLVDQLTTLNVPMSNGGIVMTLLESIPSSFENLIMALGTRCKKGIILKSVTLRLLHEVSRTKEHNIAAMDNMALVAHHEN